jgi:assimilatory nitrate reductase catalytic subunit
VLFRRVEAARARNPNLKVIVVDPRRTDTARFADLHLAILPGTDVALFHAMLHVMLWEGRADLDYVAAHVEGLDALRATVREWSPAVAAETCGVKQDDIVTAARWFGGSAATLSLYCQGLNQSSSGTAKNAALINLHLATGQIGKPGAGPFSLTGQPNAMGGREVGGLANQLAAHMSFVPDDIDRVGRFWNAPRVAPREGLKAVQMFEAIARGKIKALWVMATNPAVSLPRAGQVREALGKLELFVVSENVLSNDTVNAGAQILLPAAAWGEKDGTVTNSERRISRVRAAVPPPGEARADWKIAVDFARRLFPDGERLFPYESAESVFNEHRETTRGRDLNITGLSYALLAERGPQQWPFPEGAAAGRKRLYEDGVFPTPSGRARFVPTPYVPVAEDADESYPLRLTTGRLRDQWHAMSRTGTVASLFAHEPEPRVGAHAEDLARLGLVEGDLVKLASRRGYVFLRVTSDADLARGVVYVPMHWGARFLGGAGRRGVNELTIGALDPSSRQPELKHCAVRMEKANLPWRLIATSAPADLAALMKETEPFMSAAPYVVRTLVGRERPAVRLSLAAEKAPAEDLLGRIRKVFGEGAIVRAGDASDPWLKAGGPPERGRTVCNCFDVAENDIKVFLGESKSLEALQASLKCGTNCGSCVPELRRMAAA